MAGKSNQGSTSRKPKSSNRRGDTTFAGAPVAVSDELRQFTRFIPGKDSSGLRMHSRYCFCSIQSVSTKSTGAAFRDRDGGEGYSVTLSLLDSGYVDQDLSSTYQRFTPFSPIFTLVGTAFQKYRLYKFKVFYMPQCPTTASGQLTFAFSKDPVNPLLWTTSDNITPGNLLAMADSIPFAPWRAWEMDLTRHLDISTWFYTNDRADTGATTSNDGAGAQIRQANWGTMSCLTDVVDTTAEICGKLYFELDVEFSEFCPVSRVTLNPSLAYSEERRITDRRKQRESARGSSICTTQEIAVGKATDPSSAPVPTKILRLSPDEKRAAGIICCSDCHQGDH